MIHPDKHPGDDTATKRFQDTQTFNNACVEGLGTKKRRLSSTLPLQFHIQERWSFLNRAVIHPSVPPLQPIDAATMEKIVAFQCINYRGAIAHGKRTELIHDFDNSVMQSPCQSAYEVLSNQFGGCKTLDSIEEIKEEIMERGPVLSTSFQPTHDFLNAGSFSYAFHPSLVSESHPLLLVGWQQTAYGEMWIVRSPMAHAQDIPISIHQFSLEDNVIAPANDLSNFPWQKPNKAFDIQDLAEDWYSWDNMYTDCQSEQLAPLFQAIGKSWAAALTTREPFVIRQADKIARSRYAYLNDIEWVEATKKWRIRATFCDHAWTNPQSTLMLQPS